MKLLCHRRKLSDLGTNQLKVNKLSRASGATLVKSKKSSIDIVRQHGLDFKKLNKRLALKKLDTRSMKEVLLHEDCLGNLVKQNSKTKYRTQTIVRRENILNRKRIIKSKSRTYNIITNLNIHTSTTNRSF